jgi:GH15 family glucan-1,4-alpha-glucosidase
MVTAPLVAAIAGNSRMLAGFDAKGELRQLFWPHIDSPNHVAGVTAGVRVSGRDGVHWLSGGEWTHRQRYIGFAPVLETVAESVGLGLTVVATDFVTPGQDTLVRRYQLRNSGIVAGDFRFIFYAAFLLAESHRYNTVFWEPEASALAFYRRGIWIALGGARVPAAYRVGPRPYEGSAWNDAQDGELGGGVVEMGDVDAALAWDSRLLQPGEQWQISVFIACGSRQEEAFAALAAARGQGAGALAKQAQTVWREWICRGDGSPSCAAVGGSPSPVEIGGAQSSTELARAGSAQSSAELTGTDGESAGQLTLAQPALQAPSLPQAEDEEVITALWRRSLMVMRLLADEAGGIIAAPEFDPDRRYCGGYGLCWGRDAAFVVAALDAAGRYEMAEAFYRWAARVQEPAGVWYQRYYVTGELAPSWGLIQIDETGSILWGFRQHVRITGNTGLLLELWPMVERAADFLVSFRDERTGLIKASWDLWEERYGVHVYSCAAVYGGLVGAAELAAQTGQTAKAQAWERRAEELKAAVEQHFWSDLHGRFLRCVSLRVPAWAEHDPALRHRVQVLPPPPGHLYPEYAVPEDATVDVSLLGLTVPFGLFTPADSRMAATVAAIERDLTRCPAGGVQRYAGDHYRGGNPWVLCTLWLALYYIAAGERARARELFNWAVQRRTKLDLLPEQVDRNTGEPSWVVPLAWSHAMFMLTAVELLPEVAPASVRVRREG